MKKFISSVLTLCFIIYMIALVYYLFFSEKYGRHITNDEFRYNLELFKEINRYLNHRNVIGEELFLVNVVGNVVAFIPFGFLVPVTYREQRKDVQYHGGFFRSFLFVSLMGGMFSLAIEATQLVTKTGSFDVDDIFLNTLGVMLGYIGYYISKKIIRYMGKK